MHCCYVHRSWLHLHPLTCEYDLSTKPTSTMRMYVCFVVRERFVFVIASQSRIPLLLQLQLPPKMPAKQLNAKACRIMKKSKVSAKAKQGAKAHQLAKAPPAEPPHVKADPELVNPGLKSPPTPTDQSKVSKAACPDDIPYATAKARWRRAMPGHVDQRTVVPRGPRTARTRSQVKPTQKS